jgi:hypothetical protein
MASALPIYASFVKAIKVKQGAASDTCIYMYRGLKIELLALQGDIVHRAGNDSIELDGSF